MCFRYRKYRVKTVVFAKGFARVSAPEGTIMKIDYGDRVVLVNKYAEVLSAYYYNGDYVERTKVRTGDIDYKKLELA